MDALLGLILLAVYIAGVVGLAAGVTYLAIRIFPTKDRPGRKPDDSPPSDGGAGGAAGRLFRKAKREATG